MILFQFELLGHAAIICICLYSIFFLSLTRARFSFWSLLIFLVFAVRSITILIHHLKLGFEPLDWFFFPTTWMVLPPAIYLYTREVFAEKIPRLQVWWHFVPFGIFVLLSYVVPNDWNSLKMMPEHPLIIPLHSALIVSVVVYFFFILRVIRQGNYKVQDYFSETSEFLTMKSVTRTIYVFIVVFFAASSVVFLPLPPRGFHVLVDVSFLVVLSFFSFYVINQALVSHRELSRLPEPEELPEKTEVPEGSFDDIIPVLEAAMQEKQYYLDHKISVPALATELNVPMQRLSSAINTHYGHNFFHYINTLRIAHACVLLKDPAYDNRTLASIAEDAGFSSKSTFNTRFKQVMNMTPSAYKKEVASL